jgi:hypothetical protein
MALKRLLGLGSKRLRALTILVAAAKALRRGRPLRGAALLVGAILAWKYFVAALVVETVLGLLRRDGEGDEVIEVGGGEGTGEGASGET